MRDSASIFVLYRIHRGNQKNFILNHHNLIHSLAIDTDIP
jgi:hypothetical protein